MSHGKAHRAILLLLAVTAATLAGAGIAAPVLIGALDDVTRSGGEPAVRVAAGVTVVAVTGLALVAAWLMVCTAWCVLASLGNGLVARAPGLGRWMAPRLVRLLVGATLGTTALAAPAAAAPPTPGGAGADGPPLLPQALAGLPLPDRQPGAARPSGAAAKAQPAIPRAPSAGPSPTEPRVRGQDVSPTGAVPSVTGAPARSVEPPAVAGTDEHRGAPGRPGSHATHAVAPGESLWSIAAAHLAPEADPALVARGCQALYDANRSSIGSDPDLIRPGTTLRLPRPLR